MFPDSYLFVAAARCHPTSLADRRLRLFDSYAQDKFGLWYFGETRTSYDDPNQEAVRARQTPPRHFYANPVDLRHACAARAGQGSVWTRESSYSRPGGPS